MHQHLARASHQGLRCTKQVLQSLAHGSENVEAKANLKEQWVSCIGDAFKSRKNPQARLIDMCQPKHHVCLSKIAWWNALSGTHSVEPTQWNPLSGTHSVECSVPLSENQLHGNFPIELSTIMNNMTNSFDEQPQCPTSKNHLSQLHTWWNKMSH